MQSVTVHDILHKVVDHVLGVLIYVVHEGDLVFYVGQSKRDVVVRFWEHLQKPSRLGELIELNRPDSEQWQVTFYALADCRATVSQKSLFALQAWEHFDMDMAEAALIKQMRPVLNRDFNPRPTPLPSHYRGLHLSVRQLADFPAPEHRLWLNRMSLAGWTYQRGPSGQVSWQHRDGRQLTQADMQRHINAGSIP